MKSLSHEDFPHTLIRLFIVASEDIKIDLVWYNGVALTTVHGEHAQLDSFILVRLVGGKLASYTNSRLNKKE